MYKVKPEDVIPTRTQEKVKLLIERNYKMSGSKKKYIKRSRKLYDRFIDLARNMTRDKAVELVELAHKISDLANTESTKNAVCAKGCSWCCKINVEITAIEAAYIELKTGRIVTPRPYTKKHDDPTIEYCPFHDEQAATCSIHEFRPMACRGFFAYDDPKFCVDPSTVHAVTNAWHIPATKHIIEVLETVCGNEINDIRGYFN